MSMLMISYIFEILLNSIVGGLSNLESQIESQMGKSLNFDFWNGWGLLVQN